MPTIDELGSRAAAQLTDQVRAAIDVEARLAELHASGATVSPLRRRVPPRVWGAAASVAIIAIGAIGIVALRSGSGAVAPTPTTTDTPDSTEPSPPTTDAPVDTVAEAPLEPIAVSYQSPPPMFEPTPFTTVSADASVGLFEDGVVVATLGTVSTITWAGESSEPTQISYPLSFPVAYEGVVYGLAQASSGPVMVSAALQPSRVGVLRTTPVSSSAYAELPPAPFGLGKDGIVDRVRDVGTTLIPYEADGGTARTFDGAVAVSMNDSGLVTSSTGTRWQLAIETAPAEDGWPNTAWEQTAPASPTVDGGAVLLATLGPPVQPSAEYSEYTMPVIAQLGADGDGRWWSLPEGWSIAASDVFGTVLRRSTPDGVELARFPDSPPAPSSPVSDAAITEVDVEPRAFPLELDGCGGCSIDSLADGRLIVFRESTGSFVLIAADGTTQEIRLDQPPSASLLAVGPDDVVYLVTRATSEEPTDIIAFRLGTSMATEIARAKAVGDPSGDTDIVPTTNGLVAVGCCSFDPIRPDPNAEPLMRWVNRDGATVTDSRPQIRVETVVAGEGAANGVAFVREDANGTVKRWPATGGIEAFIRGMPGVAPLDDGGAIVVYQDLGGAATIYLRLKPNGAIERTTSAPQYAFPIRSGALYGWGDGSFEQIVLATFTDPVDALGGGLPTGSSADDVIQQLVAQRQPQVAEQGDCVTSVRVVGRTGTDPVIATIASRNPCDDSVGGQNLTSTIGSDADGRWAVTAATEANLCLRGTDGVVCV
ncbi:MAG: hypothetical protein ACOYL9_01505 [Ilumatobacteraceae bacterium]